MDASLEYVFKIQEVQERKKFEFVEPVRHTYFHFCSAMNATFCLGRWEIRRRLPLTERKLLHCFLILLHLVPSAVLFFWSTCISESKMMITATSCSSIDLWMYCMIMRLLLLYNCSIYHCLSRSCWPSSRDYSPSTTRVTNWHMSLSHTSNNYSSTSRM